MLQAEDVVKCLSKANERGRDVWRVRLYTEEGNKLILYATKNGHRVSEVLVFYGTEYLRLPFRLAKPVFHLSDALGCARADLKYVVLISVGTEEFSIVCEDVKFYEAEER